MRKISKLFLLLLLLGGISSVQIQLNEEEEEAIEIEIGSAVEFDKNRNYFKFLYEAETTSKIIFRFEENDENLYLTYPSGKRIILGNNEYSRKNFEGNLTENGTYYLEVKCYSFRCEIGGFFNSFLFGSPMKTIDLSQNSYFMDFSLYLQGEYYGCIEYKVSGLKEDKYVYFINTRSDEYYYTYYYPYYPDYPLVPPYDPYEPYPFQPEYHPNLTAFEVLNIMTNESTRFVSFYKFEKDTEYIIKIHSFVYYFDYNYNYDYKYYEYLSYIFFPLTQENYKLITGQEDYLYINGPTLGLIQPNNIKSFNLFIGSFGESDIVLGAKTDEQIGYDLENLSIILQLDFSFVEGIQIESGDPQTTVAIIIPFSHESTTKIYLVDELEQECKDSYIIPANKAKLIYCNNEKYKELEYYNNITTYISDIKNMHIIFSEENEGTDYLIHNYMNFPVFVEKSNQEHVITLKNYPPKFTFFGAENPYLFNAFYKFGEKYAKQGGININNYLKLTQMNFRINSKYLPWFEYYNFYLNQLDIKLNVYIKQIYGGTEIYECSADNIDQKDLTFLVTPISNVKCENKKSIFNRLFTFDGTKIMTGYITPDSYFDIYAEIRNETKTEIEISQIMTDSLMMTNTAKYIKKNIKYTFNFNLDHLVKLEPGSNAEITITNGQTSAIINILHPTASISGKGYSIESSEDAMIYFIGKFSSRELVQKEIDIEKSKGKIVKVSNVDSDILVDIGFEGYYPSTLPMDFREKDSGIYYFDNIYEKMKGKLVEGEKVYIYHYANRNENLKIEYIGKSLAHKNNDFNIYFIPGNNEENSLIVNAFEIRDIIPDIHFCQKDTILQLSIIGSGEERIITIKNDDTLDNITLSRGDNKMTFSTNKPLIFSYSYYDIVDEDYFNRNGTKETLWDERIVLNDLKIEEVNDKDNENDTIKIKFKPNYKQSSTRYIIIIVQENSENTFDNLNDPCYITDLLNQRPNGVKIDTIYDVGENDTIEAEVDISDILHETGKYIVNIISQELRFEKKINYYIPLEFEHDGKSPDEEEESQEEESQDEEKNQEEESQEGKSQEEENQEEEEEESQEGKSQEEENQEEEEEESQEGKSQEEENKEEEDIIFLKLILNCVLSFFFINGLDKNFFKVFFKNFILILFKDLKYLDFLIFIA